MPENRDLDERSRKHDAAERPSDPKAIEKPGQTPDSDPVSAELSDEDLGNVSGGMNKHLSSCTY